ncbi:hypothetical protein LTR53_012581 [Teratosphaeriaceae sp. CCFEE 6253]|nr:hypothetical protein LTR53_012581 [Teratosphaeriaceae sp. CCFEE 6253]
MPPAPIFDEINLPDDVPESRQTAANAPIKTLFSLAGRTIVVTGGGRGVGIVLATAIVEARGCVACLDVLERPSEPQWHALQSLAKRTGLSATYYRCDITDEPLLSRTLQRVADEGYAKQVPFAGIVACAGIKQMVAAVDQPKDQFCQMMNVNVTGTFLTAKHASRIFIKERTHGSIVLVASRSGQLANRGLTCTAYSTSKSAVHQMCRSMAQEIGVHGIRINTLSPGYVRTAMLDELLTARPDLESTYLQGPLLGRLGAPEDLKAPTIFLLASGSSYMTGADLRIDGGHCASALDMRIGQVRALGTYQIVLANLRPPETWGVRWALYLEQS